MISTGSNRVPLIGPGLMSDWDEASMHLHMYLETNENLRVLHPAAAGHLKPEIVRPALRCMWCMDEIETLIMHPEAPDRAFARLF